MLALDDSFDDVLALGDEVGDGSPDSCGRQQQVELEVPRDQTSAADWAEYAATEKAETHSTSIYD
eukprot:COSAG01_NODE_1215_length_11206_cov_8.747096_4_plen_65_part_00